MYVPFALPLFYPTFNLPTSPIIPTKKTDTNNPSNRPAPNLAA